MKPGSKPIVRAERNGPWPSEVSRLLHRSIGCGEIRPEDAKSRREVVLTGWVHRRRDLGQLIFVELRDATGRVQVVFDPDRPAIHAIAESFTRRTSWASRASS